MQWVHVCPICFQFLTFDIVEEFCCKLKSLLYLKRHTLSVSKSEKKGFMIEPSAATVKKIQQSKVSMCVCVFVHTSIKTFLLVLM